MRNSGLIVGGAVIFIMGLLLTSGLLDWLIRAIGALTMIGGVVLFALGVWSTARRRQGRL